MRHRYFRLISRESDRYFYLTEIDVARNGLPLQNKVSYQLKFNTTETTKTLHNSAKQKLNANVKYSWDHDFLF